MTFATFLSWLLCGLVVGLIARALVPGRQRMGLIVTIVLGVVGAVLGGWLFSFVKAPTGEPFSWSGDAWQGWLVSIVGAALVLWIYIGLNRRRSWI